MVNLKLKTWRTVGAAVALVSLGGCYAHGSGGYGGGYGGGQYGERGASAAKAASVENAVKEANAAADRSGSFLRTVLT